MHLHTAIDKESQPHCVMEEMTPKFKCYVLSTPYVSLWMASIPLATVLWLLISFSVI